jgi:F-type H+-transporting ATPase subunit b
MRLASLITILSLIISEVAMAAPHSDGHHPSMLDLKWPFVNFVLLFSFLIWKIKAPLAKMFAAQAEDVQQLYTVAEEKDKEANLKLDMFEKKSAQTESDYAKVLEEARRDAVDFSKLQEKETVQQIARMKTDLESKVAYERDSLLRGLSSAFLDEVISRAKGKIKSDKGLQEKAATKLMSQVR